MQNPTQLFVTVRFDDQTIDREAQYLPEQYREDYRFLKAFVRDECNKDIDLFMDHLRRLGIDGDKTTWNKIIRGRINRDRTGQPTEHPVISYEKFGEFVKAIRDNTRIESIRGRIPFIETSTTIRMFDYIDDKRRPETVNKFGFIIGETGSGKSAAASEYRRRNNHGMCVHLEATESKGPMEFVQKLAGCYGISPRRDTTRMRHQLFQNVTHKNCIIIDNAQELWLAGVEDQPKFSLLRRLQDERGCTIILIVTPLFANRRKEDLVMGYFEQFVGRSGGLRSWLRLPAFPPADDCVAIAKAMGLQDAAKYRKQLAEIASEPGRIRRLFEDLQQAKRTATSQNKPFTYDFVLEERGEG